MDRRRAGAGSANSGIAVVTAIHFLTATCTVAIHRAAAASDVASVAFVAVSYGALLLLHRTLGAYETAMEAPEDGAAAAAEPKRERLRRRVWALSALLTVLFAWKVAGVVPWLAGVLVWAAGVATSAGGFFALVPRRSILAQRYKQAYHPEHRMDRRRATAARANGGIAVHIAIVLLTVTSAAAIHRVTAAGDMASVAFVAVSYGTLLLLHRTLGAYETTAEAPEDAAAAETERERLRRRIWALRCSGPPESSSGAAAVATSAGGFFAVHE